MRWKNFCCDIPLKTVKSLCRNPKKELFERRVHGHIFPPNVA